MTIPQRRNQKKHKGRPRSIARAYRPYRGVPLLRGDEYGRPAIEETCDDELAGLSFEERLMSIRRPGDWLAQVPYMPTLGDRLLGVGRGGFLDKYNADDEDYNTDIGTDFDDLYDFEEEY